MNSIVMAQILSNDSKYFIWVRQEKDEKMKFVGIQCTEIMSPDFCEPVEINSLHEALELGSKMYNSES